MGNYLAGEQGVAGGGGAGGSQEGVGGWTHADGSPRLRLSKKLPRFTRLRCLCLHGHGSNNDITQMQVDNLKLEEHHGVACDLFEAAHPCDAQDDIMPFFSRAPFRSWVGSFANANSNMMVVLHLAAGSQVIIILHLVTLALYVAGAACSRIR